MASREFTLEAVKEFIVNSGGKVTNHDLVTKFKNYLNDPQDKVLNREKFKDFVNSLATIKIDEKGEKLLVLKKKYRDRVSDNNSYLDIKADSIRAQSEPPRNDRLFNITDSIDTGMSSRGHSERNLSDRVGASVSQSSLNDSIGSEISSSSFSSIGAADEDADLSLMSVKERAQHLNRIESESQLQNTSSAQKKRDNRTIYRDRDGDDDSSGTGYVEFDTIEKEWLATCASADYHNMHQLLNKRPALAKLRVNTALHFAAKHGKADVVKMIASKSGVNVNQKTGYTPLHLAAMQGHEEIIELLVHTYKADPNVRDYSGKKAKQYLKFSASSRAQRKYDPDDSFMRNASFRKSNRVRAISSLIQGSGTGMKQFQTSWDDMSIKDTTPKSTPGTSPANSVGPSPVQQRKGHFSEKEKHLMPPPSAPSKKSSRTHYSYSKESLISEEKRFSEKSQVTRSESEPNLGGSLEAGSSKQTYV
ncbi:hypothetical protein ACJMK2_010543 [Sinanodonta woodiana]|uniref:SOWAHA-C winged helix-turn-helix domain-containing protein n=1 Tax=Sinanodonta woodiana TaxID=1069815 RepID=A0ABD3VFQ6_SINWO